MRKEIIILGNNRKILLFLNPRMEHVFSKNIYVKIIIKKRSNTMAEKPISTAAVPFIKMAADNKNPEPGYFI